MTKGKVLLGVLAGLTAGAAIGMLLAPEKGERTRRRLARKGQDLADSIRNTIGDRFDNLLESLEGNMKKPVTHREVPSDKTV